MMTINIKQEPIVYEEFNSYENSNYNLTTQISVTDDADATEYMAAFVKSLQVEGFTISTIANTLYNYALYLKDNENIELYDTDKEYILVKNGENKEDGE